MCTYIGLVLPDGIKLNDLRNHIGEPLDPKTLENRHIQEQLRPGESIYLATSNYCDCDTPLGKQGGLVIPGHEVDIDREELMSWTRSLRSLILSGVTPYVGIFLHYYSGDISMENVRFISTQNVPDEQLTPIFLENIEYDALYRIGKVPIN